MNELMENRGGHRFLRILIIALILGGAVFIWRFSVYHLEVNHREEDARVILLDQAYQLCRQELIKYYDEKIKLAPDEIISMKYQQDRSSKLQEAQDRYFRDKRALRRDEGGNWRAHWADQIKTIETGQGYDDPTVD